MLDWNIPYYTFYTPSACSSFLFRFTVLDHVLCLFPTFNCSASPPPFAVPSHTTLTCIFHPYTLAVLRTSVTSQIARFASPLAHNTTHNLWKRAAHRHTHLSLGMYIVAYARPTHRRRTLAVILYRSTSSVLYAARAPRASYYYRHQYISPSWTTRRRVPLVRGMHVGFSALVGAARRPRRRARMRSRRDARPGFRVARGHDITPRT